MAADTEPLEILLHLPLLAEDKVYDVILVIYVLLVGFLGGFVVVICYVFLFVIIVWMVCGWFCCDCVAVCGGLLPVSTWLIYCGFDWIDGKMGSRKDAEMFNALPSIVLGIGDDQIGLFLMWYTYS